jgi:hypothetical protein
VQISINGHTPVAVHVGACSMGRSEVRSNAISRRDMLHEADGLHVLDPGGPAGPSTAHRPAPPPGRALDAALGAPARRARVIRARRSRGPARQPVTPASPECHTLTSVRGAMSLARSTVRVAGSGTSWPLRRLEQERRERSGRITAGWGATPPGASRGCRLLDPANARAAHRRCSSARGNRSTNAKVERRSPGW